jgi:prevent-host-death family protein
MEVPMSSWQVQQAKAHFSEVMAKARTEGPQTITRHGKDEAVLLSVGEFNLMKQRKPTLIEVLLGGPKFDDFEIPPNDETPRDVDLGD